MKRFCTASAVAFVALFLVAGCNDYGNTFQNNTGATITSLSPQRVSAGHADFTLTVNGGGFVTQTKIQWNGTSLKTTPTTDGAGSVLNVTATITAAMVAKQGNVTVITLNPFSGAGNNGLSNPLIFIIDPPPNPSPTLMSITPSSAVMGATSPLSISLTGTSFLSNSDPTQASQVNWVVAGTQTKLTVGTITSTSIQATVPTALLASAGTASVTVFNPPSPPPPGCNAGCAGGGGGGPSSALTFTICAAAPCSGAVAQGSAASALVAEETPAVSLDARYVAYTAMQNDHAHIFLRDTCEGAQAGCQARATLLSVAPDGAPADGESHNPSMSADGRYVAFSSSASNLIENAAPGRQIYLRDTCAGAGDSCKPSTTLISVDPSGALVGAESVLPSVSASGRFVAFLAITPSHSSTHAAPGAPNSGFRQVFVRDTCSGATQCTPKTTRISMQPGEGTVANAGPALSGNARRVAIPSGNAATLFTRSVAVDDRVFLAIATDHH